MRKREELVSGCMAKAGADEMTFVLLSRDAAAPATIRFWARERVILGKNAPDDPQVVEAEQCARVMEAEGGRHKPAAAPAIGDSIDYDAGKLMGTLAAEVVGVQPGNVHVEPLYQIRLAGTGETIWTRPNLCRPRAQPRPPGSVLAALRLLDALAGRLHGRSANLPPDLADLGADVAEVARELEATLPPGPEEELRRNDAGEPLERCAQCGKEFIPHAGRALLADNAGAFCSPECENAFCHEVIGPGEEPAR